MPDEEEGAEEQACAEQPGRRNPDAVRKAGEAEGPAMQPEEDARKHSVTDEQNREGGQDDQVGLGDTSLEAQQHGQPEAGRGDGAICGQDEQLAQLPANGKPSGPSKPGTPAEVEA